MLDLFAFKSDLTKRGIFFCFSGPISQDLIVELGDMLKQRMKLVESSKSTIIKVFSMVVEQSQNIIHYSAETLLDSPNGDSELSFGIIAVGYDSDHYFVLCGNNIENHRIDGISERINRLNAMSKEQLKKYYREQRKKSPEDTSKGAGLGFIEMAKTASKPLEFEFKKIDDKVSFFSMRTYI